MSFEIEFVKTGLGYLPRGQGVRVDLEGAASDVYLTDDSGLFRLESGDIDGFLRNSYGGHYTTSPVVLGTPSPGRWNTVVVPINGQVHVRNVALVRLAA